MLSKTKPTPDGSVESPGRPKPAERRVNSTDLFGDASVIFIGHEGDTYTLRKTRNGKLILTK